MLITIMYICIFSVADTNFFIAPPPAMTITPMAISFTLGANVTLTCIVSADNVDEHAMAVVKWRRNRVIINGTQTTISPTMESSLYNINGTTVHTITGLDSSEEGEYTCSSYIKLNISNEYILDSDTVNISKSILIEGRPMTLNA